jgi:hypothetical protein
MLIPFTSLLLYFFGGGTYSTHYQAPLRYSASGFTDGLDCLILHLTDIIIRGLQDDTVSTMSLRRFRNF